MTELYKPMVQVKVKQFEGPLDLLLQLIENQELDITTVSLAQVTEQFLGHVKTLETKDPNSLADFLVIAAKLLVIKSKALLPTLELDTEEEEEAFDLTDQLLQYKKYKEAGRFLRSLELKRRQAWIRESGFQDKITFVPDPNATTQSLADSLRTLAVQLQEIVRLPQDVVEEVMSISEKITHIQTLISEKVESSLTSLLKETKNKTEVIVTFLALLELVKQRILTVEQNQAFADIMIKSTKSHGSN